MKIIIGASRPIKGQLGSRLIQWWQNTDYSHIYVRWHLNFQERDIVFHASHGMVHQIELNNFTRDNTVVEEYILDLSEEQFKKLSQKAIDLSGTDYSYIELVQIFITDISKGKIEFIDQKGYICSELIAELLEEFFKAKLPKENWLMRPDDIINYLKNQMK